MRTHCGAFLKADPSGVRMKNHYWNCLTCQAAERREEALHLAETEVSEEISRAVGQVVHTLIGPADAVRLVAQRIFDEYPPVGYGTRAAVFPDRTVVVHARSCE